MIGIRFGLCVSVKGVAMCDNINSHSVEIAMLFRVFFSAKLPILNWCIKYWKSLKVRGTFCSHCLQMCDCPDQPIMTTPRKSVYTYLDVENVKNPSGSHVAIARCTSISLTHKFYGIIDNRLFIGR